MSTTYKLVIVESPFAGDVEKNQDYARVCMHDCLMKGEAPYASHLLYTQPGVLDDLNKEERKMGITAGLDWGTKAEKSVVYMDLGMSTGMEQGIARAKAEGREVEYRQLPGFEMWNENYENHRAYKASHQAIIDNLTQALANISSHDFAPELVEKASQVLESVKTSFNPVNTTKLKP